MTVSSLLEEQPTAKLITATKESIEQMTQELAALMTSYTKVHIEICNVVKPPKAGKVGLRMSHK